MTKETNKATNVAVKNQDAQLAKKAKETLNNFGLKATYAQCLELLARLGGARTLHVKQAKSLEENVSKVALRQASDLMFTTFGSYPQPTAVDVIGAMASAFALEATSGSRAVEAAMHDIFSKGVVLREPYDEIKESRLPEVFWRLVQRLQESIQKQAVHDQEALTLYMGTAIDWSVSDGSAEKDHVHGKYSLAVSKNSTAVFVDMGPLGVNLQNTEDPLHAEIAVIIEVNDGVPCVHIANEVFGDVMLSVFSTKQGLLLEPGHSDQHIRTGVVSEAEGYDKAPGEVSLFKLQDVRNQRLRMNNNAFLISQH